MEFNEIAWEDTWEGLLKEIRKPDDQINQEKIDELINEVADTLRIYFHKPNEKIGSEWSIEMHDIKKDNSKFKYRVYAYGERGMLMWDNFFETVQEAYEYVLSRLLLFKHILYKNDDI